MAVGSVYATSSKADAGDPVGIETVAEVVRAVKVPVVAIGGITADRLAELCQAGAASAAVMSAVSRAEDMVLATERLVAAWSEAQSSLHPVA